MTKQTTIPHNDWQTAITTGDEFMAKRCRLEHALDGWESAYRDWHTWEDFADAFWGTPSADICLGLGEWDGFGVLTKDELRDELREYWEAQEICARGF